MNCKDIYFLEITDYLKDQQKQIKEAGKERNVNFDRKNPLKTKFFFKPLRHD